MAASEPEKFIHEDNASVLDEIYHVSKNESPKQLSFGNNLNNDANPNNSLKKQQEVLFQQIEKNVNANVDENIIKGCKTKKGKTQEGEEITISIVRKTLIAMGLTFQEAGSQQSRDFRNVGGIGLDIEIKKLIIFKFTSMILFQIVIFIISFSLQERRKKDNQVYLLR